MSRRSVARVFLFVMASLAILPQMTLAQSGIAGVGKDATGAILPGVTMGKDSNLRVLSVHCGYYVVMRKAVARTQ